MKVPVGLYVMRSWVIPEDRLCSFPVLFHRYNGSLPNGDRGRRKSRFALFKRPKANGVKPSTVHIACTPQAAKVSLICPQVLSEMFRGVSAARPRGNDENLSSSDCKKNGSCLSIGFFWCLSRLARNPIAKQIWCPVLPLSRREIFYFWKVYVQGTD